MTDAVLNSQVQSPLVRALTVARKGDESHKQFSHHIEEAVPPVVETQVRSVADTGARSAGGKCYFGDTVTFRIPRKGFWSGTVLEIETFLDETVSGTINTFHYDAFGVSLVNKAVLRTASTIIQTVHAESIWLQIHQLRHDQMNVWRKLSSGVLTSDNVDPNTRANQLADNGFNVKCLIPLFLWFNDSVSTLIDTERVEDLFLDVNILTMPKTFNAAPAQPEPYNASGVGLQSYIVPTLICNYLGYEQHVHDAIWEKQVKRDGVTSFMGRTESLIIESDIAASATSTINLSPLQLNGDIFDILLHVGKDEGPGPPTFPGGQRFIGTIHSPTGIKVLEGDQVIRDFGDRNELAITAFKNPVLRGSVVEQPFPLAQHDIISSGSTATNIFFAATMMRLPFGFSGCSQAYYGAVNPAVLKNLKLEVTTNGAGASTLYCVVRQHTVFSIDGRTGQILSQQHV